jgi:uncharacterized protein YjbI with pentapeptide repeats
LPAAAQADIFRWDNGQLIPGTEGITPGPGVDLGSASGQWNSPQRNLRFADFSSGLDLTLAIFYNSWLDDSRFNGANLTRANLVGASLTNADLSGTNLTNASLGFAGCPIACGGVAILTNANLSGAVVTGAQFDGNTSFGFTKEQLYSTASYQQRNLGGIRLRYNDLTGWDFSGQDLTGASFSSTLTNANFAGSHLYGADFNSSTLTNANLAGTIVALARFSGATSRGFTKEQLYSTASYQQRNLLGIGLSFNDLTGWDFSGQDLSGASLGYSTLTNANLSGTNLANADLTDANFTGAKVQGVSFDRTFSCPAVCPPVRGITLGQLYSTASYRQKDLRGIGLIGIDLTGGDFSFADLRGSRFSSGSFESRNTIWPFGSINGLDLAAGETLVVRDSTIGVSVRNSMNIVNGGTLELVLEGADWGSTMAVAAGVTPDLGGTLQVRFADQANLASMVGTTFDFFDWPGVFDTKNRFDAIELPLGTQWDLTQLYVTGTATLTAIPEPSAVLLVAYSTAAWILGWAFCQRPQVRPL